MRKLSLTHAGVVRVARNRARDYIRNHRTPTLCTVAQEACDSVLSDCTLTQDSIRTHATFSTSTFEPTLKVVFLTPRPRFTHRSLKRTPSVQPERYVARSRCEVELRTVAA